jgi:hypothetical protein
MGGISIGGIIYIIVGVVVASNQGYLADVATLSQLISAIVAVMFWPLLILGANLHIVL